MIRQALKASLASTPNVLEETIFLLRQQLSDQLETARKALDGEDFDLAATQLGHASVTARALHENLEIERAQYAQGRVAVVEATDETLAAELIKRAEKGEAGARAALLAAAKRVKQPKTEAHRGRS